MARRVMSVQDFLIRSWISPPSVKQVNGAASNACAGFPFSLVPLKRADLQALQAF